MWRWPASTCQGSNVPHPPQGASSFYPHDTTWTFDWCHTLHSLNNSHKWIVRLAPFRSNNASKRPSFIPLQWKEHPIWEETVIWPKHRLQFIRCAGSARSMARKHTRYKMLIQSITFQTAPLYRQHLPELGQMWRQFTFSRNDNNYT